MKRKKIVSILSLTLALLITFAACGNNGNSASPSNAGTDSSSNSNNTGVMNETGFPIVNEPITLKIASYTGEPHKDGFEGIEMIKRWEEETGITLEFDTVPQSSWETRKSLIFSSGDIPDLICTNAGLTDDDIATFADQQLIVPLEDLIEEYGENLNSILNENPHYKSGMITPDGHIYSYPALADIDFGNRGAVLYLNKQWLNEAGIEIETVKGEFVEYAANPLTTDEFADILRAFKDNNLGAYPYSGEDGISSFFDLYASFGAYDNSIHLAVENGNVEFTATNPNIKDAISWLHGLYSEELIDPELFTQDFSMLISKLQTDPYTVGATKVWTIQQAYDMEDPRYEDWILIPPLTGPTGITEWAETVPSVTNGFAVITANNQYPEISARLMDYFYDEYNSVDLMIGPIGSATLQMEDGTFVQQPVPEDKTHNEWVGQHNPGCMPFICPPSVTNRCEFNDAVTMTVDVGQVYRPYQVQKDLPKLLLTAEERQIVADFKANAMDYIKRKQAEWVQNGNWEEEWDEYVNELEKMGYKEYVNIYQNAYDAAMGN